MGGIFIKEYQYNERIQLTKNWNSYEFRCHGKNHTHNTKINLALVKMVQDFMDLNGYDKGIMSRGYSCDEYNKSIGGAKASKHVTEGAMDVSFYKNGKIVPAKEVCCKAQDYGFKGISYIDKNYVHLDNRVSGLYRGDETRGYANNVGNDFYAYFGIKKVKTKYNGELPKLPQRGYFVNGDRGEDVKKLQQFLNWALNTNLDVDGIVGFKTLNAVLDFQKLVNIKEDKFFGKDTLNKAKNYHK